MGARRPTSRRFFGLGALGLIWIVFIDLLLDPEPVPHSETTIRLVGAAIATWAALSRSERVHTAIAAASLLPFALFALVTAFR